MERSERILYALLIVLICSLMLIAMILEGPLTVLQNTLRLQTQAARLISDFTLHGVGTAMFNAASVGLLALVLIYYASVSLSGPTISAILTMMGFSFFGNTLLNSIPLILGGVWLASKLARKTFGSYSLIALFGTALGPLGDLSDVLNRLALASLHSTGNCSRPCRRIHPPCSSRIHVTTPSRL